MNKHLIGRRQFIASQAAIAIASRGSTSWATASSENSIPVRAITRGPKHHWFGYYDKHQFDPTNRFVLGMQVDFEHRSPTADDTIKIGMVDLGHFHLPPIYTGEWRVDTHPRLSRDGKLVCIDSPAQDQGRQLHLIDISGLT